MPVMPDGCEASRAKRSNGIDVHHRHKQDASSGADISAEQPVNRTAGTGASQPEPIDLKVLYDAKPGPVTKVSLA